LFDLKKYGSYGVIVSITVCDTVGVVANTISYPILKGLSLEEEIELEHTVNLSMIYGT
jgi:hypothetical protein